LRAPGANRAGASLHRWTAVDPSDTRLERYESHARLWDVHPRTAPTANGYQRMPGSVGTITPWWGVPPLPTIAKDGAVPCP
jgi:hypothetical protein